MECVCSAENSSIQGAYSEPLICKWAGTTHAAVHTSTPGASPSLKNERRGPELVKADVALTGSAASLFTCKFRQGPVYMCLDVPQCTVLAPLVSM